MDGYPLHYVSHNLPFVILFGLGNVDIKPRDPLEQDYPLLQEKGIYISSDLPNVAGREAEELLSCFHDFDAKDAAWNNRPGKGKMGTMGFTYRSVGRAFTLPPHKATSPNLTPLVSSADQAPRKASLTPVLHSPLSPLTPGSPIFPDGIMTSFWFSKHQYLLPSAMISFFNFTLDPNSSTLQDNKLKSEINAVKTSITSSLYKFRAVVVLVCEDGVLDANTAERITIIRRGVSLDSKSVFFLPPRLSPVETRAFVGTVLASLQPSCLDYYRELSKHARRKKNRGSVPAPTVAPTAGTSQTLASQGWNVRYETKLGFFAECRQEMDAAGHNYEAAYENLVDRDVFDGLASWSPRFDEARLLADILAIRILRCLLWTGQTTSAVQSWTNHRYRIQDFIDRKGKGSGTYGWEAWEARWSNVMGELIEKVDVPIFHMPERPNPVDVEVFEVPDIYAIPEKAFSSDERLPPWDLLHHEGYWFRRAVQRTRARRKLALAMPKEDRRSPGNSPASNVASKSHLYDTYLCPEPHLEYGLPGKRSFDHGAVMIKALGRAAEHFSKRYQRRAVERAQYEMAREFMRAERWEEAMDLVKPLWKNLSWRSAGWWPLVEEISWAVRACARHMGDGELLVAVEWELLSNSLTPRSNWQYNISNCLENLDIEDKPYVTIDFGSTAPCLSAAFTFGASSGRVGEAVPGQLTVISQAHMNSAPINLSEITIMFEGGLKLVKISYDEGPSDPVGSRDKVYLYDVPLGDSIIPPEMDEVSESILRSPATLLGSSDLRFHPGVTKVFEVNMIPRESGEARAAKALLALREEMFDADVTIPIREEATRSNWWYRSELGLARKKLDMEFTCSVHIQPKPPKLQIELPGLKKAYYTNEHVELHILFINQEEDSADVRLDIRLVGTAEKVPAILWASNIDNASKVSVDKVTNATGSQLEKISLGLLAASTTLERVVTFQALSEMSEYVLEISAHYHLLSEPETPIVKTISKDLVFITPFEANYDFTPVIDQEIWPSYFYMEGDQQSSVTPMEGSRAKGLKQRWYLSTKLASFAVEPLVVYSTSLQILETRHGAKSALLEPTKPTPPSAMLIPNELLELSFPISIQKLSIEDRRPSALLLQLSVIWHRPDAPDALTTTILPIPLFTIPFGEPRVLASAVASPPSPLIHLAYMLENPSAHLLSFSLTMEASEEFAFSGLKAMRLSLLPLSRQEVRFNLLPTRRGMWIRPVLKVVDIGFGQTLRVAAAEGCRVDKKGISIWADAE